METTIVLAHERSMVREGLRRVLESRPLFDVVAVAEDGRAAIQAAEQHQPHVLLLDLHLARLSGVEVVRKLRQDGSRTRAVLLSAQPTARQVKDALLAGAAGFLPKSATEDELVEAIESVRRGKPYVAAVLAGDIVTSIAGDGAQDAQSELTARQREVLQLIAEGLSTKQIASELGISIRTAQTHRAKLMSRTGIHKVSSLVRYAIREGIVPV